MSQLNKRYQIFISSTFSDLKEERAEVTQAIMELGHMPYGMEAFPAANETQWEWIKRAIEESDYYIVIIGGKYGSINSKTGLSYTEMEYRYAEEVGVPTIAFLIDENIDLQKSKTESDPEKTKKLSEFRKYIETTRLRKSYMFKEDLRAKIYASILQLIKQCPRSGWMRSDSLKNYTSNDEVIRLMKENQILKKVKRDLVQGSDQYIINYTIYKNGIFDYLGEERYQGCIDLTWNEIFLNIANYLYTTDSRANKEDLEKILAKYIESKISNIIESLDTDSEQVKIHIAMEQIQMILLQFEALKYITPLNGYYWTLTKTGRNHYINHTAIKK